MLKKVFSLQKWSWIFLLRLQKHHFLCFGSNQFYKYYSVTCPCLILFLNIARIANAVPVTLYSRVTVNVESVVLNCQKCNQCLKGHKCLGMFFEGVLHLPLSFLFLLSLSYSGSGPVSSMFVIVIVFLLVRSCLLISLNKCLKGHKSLGSLSEGVL